jgi:hypothetical protein
MGTDAQARFDVVLRKIERLLMSREYWSRSDTAEYEALTAEESAALAV